MSSALVVAAGDMWAACATRGVGNDAGELQGERECWLAVSSMTVDKFSGVSGRCLVRGNALGTLKEKKSATLGGLRCKGPGLLASNGVVE